MDADAYAFDDTLLSFKLNGICLDFISSQLEAATAIEIDIYSMMYASYHGVASF
jgi:hypothetical protein